MWKILLSIFVIFVLSGCTSKYDDYLNKGKTALSEKKYQDAVTDFQMAVKEKSDKQAQQLLDEAKAKLNAQTLIKKGTSLMDNKDYDNAITNFEKVISEYKNNPKLKDSVETAKNFLSQIEKSLLDLANNSLKEQTYGDAITYLSQILKIDNNNKDAYRLLQYTENMKNGIADLDNKQYDSAKTSFTSALNFQPNDEEATKLKEEANNDKKFAVSTDAQVTDGSTNQVETQNNNGNTSSSNNSSGTPNNPSVAIQDDAKTQFKNTMFNLMNYYMQNVYNQIDSATKGMTTYDYLISTVQAIYMQSVNVNVPNPQYQSIKDNWLKYLEEEKSFLQDLKITSTIPNGNDTYGWNAYHNADNEIDKLIQESPNVYNQVLNSLNSIQ